MKWLVYAGGGVVALVLLALIILLALSGGRGEARHVHTMEIGKPTGVVFRWISEPVHLKSWVGWLVDIQTLTPAPAAVGSRTVWVMEDRNNNNERMNIQTEVTRLEPDHLIETQLSVPEGFSGTVIYELQPIDARRTHLTYRATYHYQHWLAKLLEPLISRSAQQKLNEDMQRLKQQVEAE